MACFHYQLAHPAVQGLDSDLFELIFVNLVLRAPGGHAAFALAARTCHSMHAALLPWLLRERSAERPLVQQGLCQDPFVAARSCSAATGHGCKEALTDFLEACGALSRSPPVSFKAS